MSMADKPIYIDAEVIQFVQIELQGLCDRIRNNHLQAGQKASGRTAKSIRMEVAPTSGLIHAEVVGRPYFATLETGNKPWHDKEVKPWFVGTIRQWMRDKGIKAQPIPYIRKPSERWQPKYTPEERGEMSLAWAISKNIVEHGTELYRNGGRNDIYSKEVQSTTEKILSRLSLLFEKQIDTIHLNLIKTN